MNAETISVTATAEQAAIFAKIGELYGADAGAVLLALACDRLESGSHADAESAMPLLLWQYTGARAIPQVHEEWDFKPEVSRAVPASA